MKRVLILVLCMMMTLMLCVTNASALGFADESDKFSDWARNEARMAVISDLVDASRLYEEVQVPVTRAEFCNFLWQLAMQMVGYGNLIDADNGERTAVQKFEDMDADVFCGGYYVDEVFNLGLIKGVSETRFEPERAITREEAAVMLWRMFQKFGYETGMKELSEYSDGTLVSDWAKEAVAALWSCEPFVSVFDDSEIFPKGTISYEEMVVMRWRFYEEKYGEQKILLYENTTPEILVVLGLVSQKDMDREGNITVREVLEIASKIAGSTDDPEYPNWDEHEALKGIKGFDDVEKNILLHLSDGILNPFFRYEDFGKIDFDANITYGDAYTYMLRCVENEGDYIQCDMITDVGEVYKLASDIGLIDDSDTDNANSLMPRQEFYGLLHRTVFCEYTEVWPVMRDGSWLVTNYVERKLGVENEMFIKQRSWYPEGWEE